MAHLNDRLAEQLGVTRSAIAMLGRLGAWNGDLANGAREISILHERLADDCLRSVRTSQRRLAELRDAGLVRVRVCKHRHSSSLRAVAITLTDETMAVLKGLSTKDRKRFFADPLFPFR